jgi:hypothetical protein
MTEMVWEAPPPTRREYKKERYKEAIQQLMDNPGQWARLDEFTLQTQAYSARNNLKYALKLQRYVLPAEAENFKFEFKCRQANNGQPPPKHYLYGRAIPKEEHANCPNHPDAGVWDDDYGRWCGIDECHKFLGVNRDGV